MPAVECASQCVEKKGEEVIAYPFALAPGSYIFCYFKKINHYNLKNNYDKD